MYFLILQVVASIETLSLQYVKSNICILRLGFGVKRGFGKEGGGGDYDA